MSEEKQFEPTASRLERARREGEVARSQELSSVVAFGAGLAASAAVCVPFGGAASAILESAAAGRRNQAALAAAFALMLVPAACAACGALAASVLQGGGLHFVPIAMKFDRIDPAENLKRIFSRESAITAVRATVAFLCAGAAIVPAFAGALSAALHADGVVSVAAAAWQGALRAAAIACLAGAVFAAVDYGVQFARWRRKLRMSHEELKRDQKEHDGDPLVRSRRRSLHRQIARGSVRRVKDAAFVVTNPTHIAVALEYRPPDVPVPRVLVSAADEAAGRVRDLAAVHGVPLVQNVPLARALYATARPGEFIPHETYIAVAEVIASLQRSGTASRNNP